MSLSRRHLFACMLFGCTGQPSDGSSSGAETAVGEADSSSGSTDATGDSTKPPGIELARGLGHELVITEVWLDPRASSALTLDAGGSVRLWPALPPTQTDLAALAPIRVPVREPLWLSLARAGDRSFVVAAIDTAQAARVLEIEIDDAGKATVRERFRGTPRDPLLELHVLDGGERLLALGVDHRIRLYDGQGKQLAELTEYGLAPWQLRISYSRPSDGLQGGPPEALQLAMVLAGPTRLQRFTITGDRIEKRGEARAFTLDRGPNGNDLALLPSGRVAAVLRRPLAKGQQFSIELHDLDSGQVRVLWGEIEAKWRPRMLIVDDDWALLEDGLAGYWIDLRQAVVMSTPVPFELPEKLEGLPPESHVTVLAVTLPGTTRDVRQHTSVVAGVRAVPSDRAFILDPVTPTPTGPQLHHRLGHRSAAVSAFDFAPLPPNGDLLAIVYDKKIVIESLSSGTQQDIGCSVIENLQSMQFTDPNHLLMVGTKQAQICAWRTGQIVATLEQPETPPFNRAAIHTTAPGVGEIGYRREEWIDDANKIELSHTRYENNQFGPIEPLAKPDVPRWPELSSDWELGVVDALGNRYINKGKSTRTLDITLASGEQRKLEIVPKGKETVEIRRIHPSPDGRFIAIETEPGSDDYGHGYYGGYSEYAADEPNTLGIWSTTEPPELVWSTILRGSYLQIAWTEDGSRLAMNDGRLRVITREGELVLERTTRDFQLEELPDEPSPTNQPSSPGQPK